MISSNIPEYIDPVIEPTLDDEMEDAPVLPEKIDYRSKDMELYNKWKETGSKSHMTALVNQLSPLIHKEVSRVAGTLPIAALNAEGKIWTINAIKTYDPSKGFALSTHVGSYLRKVRRMNYKYQHTVRLPEDMKLDYPKWNMAEAQLKDELNTDPTEKQVAERLGWSAGKVIKFRNRVFSDTLESGNERATEVNEFSDSGLLLKHILSQLTPDEKFILENKKNISATDMARKLGVDNNRLNYLQKKLRMKLEKLKLETGL